MLLEVAEAPLWPDARAMAEDRPASQPHAFGQGGDRCEHHGDASGTP